MNSTDCAISGWLHLNPGNLEVRATRYREVVLTSFLLALKRTFVLYTFGPEVTESPTSKSCTRKWPPKVAKPRVSVRVKRSSKHAVHIASAEGLEGLTIGRLALELSMSKSGLFAHFGSKEDLQVATVEAARAIFINEVIRPAFETAQGLLRLWKLCDIWLAYVQSGVFGAAASSRLPRRSLTVDLARSRSHRRDHEGMARNAAQRHCRGHKKPGNSQKRSTPTQLAFEFNSLELAQTGRFNFTAIERALPVLARRSRALGRYATTEAGLQ